MKNTLYAAVAACIAMMATSGLVAFATAAPTNSQVGPADQELVAELDGAILHQLAIVKRRLAID